MTVILRDLIEDQWPSLGLRYLYFVKNTNNCGALETCENDGLGATMDVKYPALSDTRTNKILYTRSRLI